MEQIPKKSRYMKSHVSHLVKAHKPDNEANIKISSKEDKSFLNNMEKLNLSTLSTLFDIVHIIRMNTDVWELSKCSCSKWLKQFKCNHVIATAVKLQLTSFQAIFIHIPLEKKNNRGPKPIPTKKMTPSLWSLPLKNPGIV
jgi:hypothetical protein